MAFDPTENVHRDHILYQSTVPASVPPAVAKEAVAIAKKIADELNYVGVLAVEMFVCNKDGKYELLVNEIAPRVHNSGHWTIDGANVSQFEQHVRAVAGWPLARPHRHGQVEMTNLIGAEIDGWKKYLGQPNTTVHVYGKGEARPGRKMGHVTKVTPEDYSRVPHSSSRARCSMQCCCADPGSRNTDGPGSAMHRSALHRIRDDVRLLSSHHRLHHGVEIVLQFEADARRIRHFHAAVLDRHVVGKAPERREHLRVGFVAAHAETHRDIERELMPAMRNAAAR
jgi:hypothetical protein